MHIDNNNSGMIFKNDRKEKPEHPDYTGKANIEGVQYRVSLWIRHGKNQPYLSASFRPVEDEEERPPVSAKKDFNDEIPF